MREQLKPRFLDACEAVECDGRRSLNRRDRLTP